MYGLLTVNVGSSSVRIELFDAARQPPLSLHRAHHAHAEKQEAALLREIVGAWT
jgi:acetate kinase